MKVDNEWYVNKTDKRDLLRKANPLERNMLRYLLMFDKDLLALRQRALMNGVKIFWKPLLMGFGNMQATQE